PLLSLRRPSGIRKREADPSGLGIVDTSPMAYLVDESENWRGRPRILFIDDSTRKSYREFARRLRSAGGRLRDYERVGIDFHHVWSFDNRFRHEHPSERDFRRWHGKAEEVSRLGGRLRDAAAAVRAVSGMTVPASLIRTDEKFSPVLDHEGRPVLSQQDP